MVTLEEYKKELINYYKYEYDNNDSRRQTRCRVLKKYSDSFLEEVINGTDKFINMILEKSEHDYHGYIKIPLEIEPEIIYIDLGLIGGWWSDRVVRDSNGNIYSINLLKNTFGPYFYIEPEFFESYETYEEIDEDTFIASEHFNYYLYIQCSKEVFDKVRKSNQAKTKTFTL